MCKYADVCVCVCLTLLTDEQCTCACSIFIIVLTVRFPDEASSRPSLDSLSKCCPVTLMALYNASIAPARSPVPKNKTKKN